MPQQGSPVQFRSQFLEEALAIRGQDSLGLAAQRAVERYLAIVHHSMPTLTLGEWCALCDCGNGTGWNVITIRHLWAEIADAPELGPKWGINVESLSQRLRRMPYANLVAIVDAIERFWASDLQPGQVGWRPCLAAIVGDEAISN